MAARMGWREAVATPIRRSRTTSGARSALQRLTHESAHAEREVAEAALSHATGNEVERAYARSDLFDRRRALMDEWGHFCLGELSHD